MLPLLIVAAVIFVIGRFLLRMSFGEALAFTAIVLIPVIMIATVAANPRLA